MSKNTIRRNKHLCGNFYNFANVLVFSLAVKNVTVMIVAIHTFQQRSTKRFTKFAS